MIPVETCRGCGRLLFRHPVGNLVVRLETDALDAQTAAQALLAGRGLWRVTATSVKPARPAELSALAQRGNTEGPHIAREHRCEGTGAPLRPVQRPVGPEARPPVPKALTAPSRPSSGPSASTVHVPSAENRPSDPQEEAVRMIVDGLGATVVSVDDR